MRQHRILPDVEAKLPHDPLPKRKRVAIPAMHSENAPRSKFTREQVVGAILRNLRGESYERIAGDMGAHEMAVYHWCMGITRRGCRVEAERRHRASLQPRDTP